MTTHANLDHSKLLDDVKAHPMCYRIHGAGGRLIILYPAGDFPVGGIRCDATASSLIKALETMDCHLRDSDQKQYLSDA